MKKSFRTILALVMAVAMLTAMCLTAFAAELPYLDHTDQKVDVVDQETIIPVQISAEATQLDVTVPTAFPIAADPAGNTETADNTIITNNSFGAVVVSNITVVDNHTETEAATWHLADFNTDMSMEKVNSNQVGLAVAPQGGKNAADGTAFLETDNSDTERQVLLNKVDAGWVLDGATDARTTDELTVVYKANVSAVSETITNATVANIIITVGWYTAD